MPGAGPNLPWRAGTRSQKLFATWKIVNARAISLCVISIVLMLCTSCVVVVVVSRR